MRRLSSLQLRLSLWIGLVVVALSAWLIAGFARAVHADAVKNAGLNMEAIARTKAALLTLPLTSAMDVARTLAHGLAATAETGAKGSRANISRKLRRILEAHPSFLNVYTVWEPNAFDGDDARYVGAPCHDATGRFIPRWSRAGDGTIQCEPSQGYDAPGPGDYYSIARRAAREVIIEPYRHALRGQSTLVTSLVVPILVNGEFKGVVGVDCPLALLQRLADQESLHSDARRLYLISAGGVIAGATAHPELLGRQSRDSLAVPTLGSDSASTSFERGEALYATSPIRIGNAEATWSVVSSVPLKVIGAEVRQRIVDLTVEIVLAIGLAVLLSFLLIRRIVVAPIQRLKAATEAFSSGDYETRCVVSGHDELSGLAATFNAMAVQVASSVGDLRRSEALLLAAFENAQHYFCLVSPEGELEFANRRSLELLGASLEAVADRPFCELPWWEHSVDEQGKLRAARERAAEGESAQFLTILHDPSGESRQVDFSLTPLRDADGRIVHLIAEGHDITELQTAQSARLESESLLRAVLDSTGDLIWVVEVGTGRLLAQNRAFTDTIRAEYGVTLEVGVTPSELALSPEVAARWRSDAVRAMQTGAFARQWAAETLGRTIEIRFTPVEREERRAAVAAFGRDVTEQRQMSLALEQSEERYRHIVEDAPLGIFRREIGGPFSYVNRGLLEQFECGSLAELNRDYGGDFGMRANQAAYAAFMEVFTRTGHVQGYEVGVPLRGGTSKWLSLSIYSERGETHMSGFSVDVTEQKRLAELLHQRQKLEAVGQLAGGVAHDFNNSLSAIIGAAELLKEEDLTEEERRESVGMILTAAERAGTLTKQLLTFSRRGTKVSSVVDVASVVEDAVAILRRTLDKRIEIVSDLQAARTLVVGDDALLQNALMNMGINAGHAMPEGGTLTVVVSNTSLDEGYCKRSPFGIEAGDYVQIEVRDTGCGMPPETVLHVFDPFFSTKPQGQGTGLGLSTVYGTVRDHRGAITVHSEVGRGTVFHVYLPVAPGDRVIIPPETSLERGSGTLLVIDDEELIRVTAKALLEGLGYTVLTAENGRTGTDLLASRRQDIDLVVLDMIMPVMGGRDAFKRIREIDAGVPVIICSGFSKEDDLVALRELSPAAFVNKPFRRVELAKAVADALRGARRGK